MHFHDIDMPPHVQVAFKEARATIAAMHASHAGSVDAAYLSIRALAEAIAAGFAAAQTLACHPHKARKA